MWRMIMTVATIGTSVIPTPALAEVSQGSSLPDGAQQFKRLINLKSDIPVSSIKVDHIL